MTPANRIAQLEGEAKAFTFLKPCIVENEPDAHTVWLKVGSQEFCVSSIACETKEEAEWMQTMLAKAIVALWEHRSKAERDTLHAELAAVVQFLEGREKVIEASIAAEVLAGNAVKESIERHALIEVQEALKVVRSSAAARALLDELARLRDEVKAYEGGMLHDHLVAQIQKSEQLQAHTTALRGALDRLLKHYVALVESGDAGDWDANTEPVVQQAQAALRQRDGGGG